MKVNPWLKYLIYILLIMGLIILHSYIGEQYEKIAKITFVYFSYRLIFLAFIYMLVGAMLGAESFFGEIKKAGQWKVNLPKLILVGIPSLYFALFVFLAYSPIKEIYNPLFKLNILIGGTGYITVFQVIFGYIVITSFYKRVN